MNGLKIENLGKAYAKKPVFAGLNAFFPTGTVCLFGPSGCGKTTLARILSGLEKPDAGTFSGISGPVVYLFQEPRLFPAFTALENVALLGRGNSLREKALGLLTRLGLSEEDCQKKPSALSGGMNQRVALARALLFAENGGGNTVLLDEPFKGLDPATKGLAVGCVKELLRGKITLVITHDGEDASLLSAEAVAFSSLLSPAI